ncbi:hypothetical protein PV326_012952, partial [Microctonus aethiopoides]
KLSDILAYGCWVLGEGGQLARMSALYAACFGITTVKYNGRGCTNPPHVCDYPFRGYWRPVVRSALRIGLIHNVILYSPRIDSFVAAANSWNETIQAWNGIWEIGKLTDVRPNTTTENTPERLSARILASFRNPNVDEYHRNDLQMKISKEKNRFRSINWEQYDPVHQKYLEISK